MVVVGLVGGAMIVTSVAIWATVKLVRFWLETEDSGALAYVPRVWQGWALYMVAAVAIEIWPGLATWASAAWTTIAQAGASLT